MVHKAGIDVGLTLEKANGDRRRIVVKPLHSDVGLRYRNWVEANRALVLQATQDRIGYVHVPDMGPKGYSEFFRYFMRESYRDGLIVDVRFNGGGHVSQFLLEKLMRKRVGYTVSHHTRPMPVPSYAVEGPIIAVTNELAGSDGDIFSHSFKWLKIGKLIGKRTWGGVVGISGNRRLVDGTLVTQPEWSNWFKDVAFGVENYGTDPDIEVDVSPDDHKHGRDPQLAMAIKLGLEELERHPPSRPNFAARPNLARKPSTLSSSAAGTPEIS